MSEFHFEELWEKCEALYQNSIQDDSSSVILDEIMMKLNIYKLAEENSELQKEEKEKTKNIIFGEILLSLTNLSAKDNVNVFEALANAFILRNSKS